MRSVRMRPTSERVTGLPATCRLYDSKPQAVAVAVSWPGRSTRTPAWRYEDQLHVADGGDGKEVWQVAGIAAQDAPGPLSALARCEIDVVDGQVNPLGFAVDADGLAAEVDCLHHGRADAAHRIDDQVARV